MRADWSKMFGCLALGLVVCWSLIPLILPWAANHLRTCGEKELHHSHATPVARMGGVALVAGFLAVVAEIFFFGGLSAAQTHVLAVLVLGSLAIFGLGLCDDFRPLGARLKFAAQVLIASGVYYGGIKIEVLKIPFVNTELALGAFGFLVTILWLVALTNMINLIDGIDGLAGGICFMLMCLLTNLGMGGESQFAMLLSVGVAGALLGFLKFNYPPARIYMGDSGAYFLGFLIGMLSIVNSNKGTVVAALVAPAFALALPIVDVGFAMLRRGLRGLPVFRPDQKHIHHYLIALGFSRQRTVLILYTVSLGCLFLAFEVCWSQGRFLPLLSGLLLLILVIAGHISGVTKNWSAIRGHFAQSMALRKETRYAIALSQWLEMEVERHQSVNELWTDYQFVVRKLGFSRVKLVLPDGTNIWQAEGLEGREADLQQVSHELGNGSHIEFSADPQVLPEHLFNLLSDLAAEIWYKAALRWQALNKTPLHFMAAASLTEFTLQRKLIRLHTPAT